MTVATRIAALRCRSKAAGLPVIYFNDNFVNWRSNLPQLVKTCLSAQCRGHKIAELLQPAEDDCVVLKPKHSGFFGTRLILTGIATDSCTGRLGVLLVTYISPAWQPVNSMFSLFHNKSIWCHRGTERHRVVANDKRGAGEGVHGKIRRWLHH